MPEPIVMTTSGRIRGAVEDTVYTFKGIPYGGPTGGKNRFLPPKKPAPWTGIRDALAFGPKCPQVELMGNANPEAKPLLGIDRANAQSEDLSLIHI